MTEPVPSVDVSAAHLMALRQALLEVVTGTAADARPPWDADACRALLAWLIEATRTTPGDSRWTLGWSGAGTGTIRRLDDRGERFELFAGREVLATLVRVLQAVRSELFEFEVPIRLRVPVEQVDEIERRLRAHLE